MAHIVRTIPYAGWKNCIHITNTVFEAVITADVGPRIVRYAKVGGPNMLWLNEFTAGETEETKTWRAYGGHSFDALVNGEAFLPPENAPVGYTLGADKVEFDTVDYGGLAKKLSVRMCRRGGLEIKETLMNTGDEPLLVAACGNTLLRSGGKAVAPLHKGEMPVAGADRPELTRGEELAFLMQDPVIGDTFEVAMGLQELWCGYFEQGSLFIMTSPKMENEAYHAGISLCFGGDRRRMRMTSFSPERLLKPGEELCHTEVWNLFTETPVPATEAEAQKWLKNNKYYYEFCKKPVPGLDC